MFNILKHKIALYKYIQWIFYLNYSKTKKYFEIKYLKKHNVLFAKIQELYWERLSL